MDTYNNILIAVDLSEEARMVTRKALVLASFYQANIYLIHVIEPVGLNSPYELSPGLPDNMQSLLEDRANNFMDNLVKEFELSEARKIVSLGSIKQQIFQSTRDNNIDLIVVGTHGRHGIAILLGSTATSVLHGTPCDVYAVKI
ncbi:MAG: universal stress protein [Gammaproteobacteria bacterium]|nr:universal stress protein [Gammaproteobacteria bacterium]